MESTGLLASTADISQGVLLRPQDTFNYGICLDNVSWRAQQRQELKIDSLSRSSVVQFNIGGILGSSIVLILFVTYALTQLQSTMALRSKRHPRRPPIVPYFIPFIGNLLPFIANSFSYCTQTTEKYGYSTPVRLRLGPLKMYLVSHADHYTALFSSKASRSMNTKTAVLLALENMFGTPSDVIPSYAADNSGVNAVPSPTSRVHPDHRITYVQVKAAQKHLSGTGLARMTEFFLGVLERRFSESPIQSEWVDQPDLYAFLQDGVVRAAVESLCGSYLLQQYPRFVEDFWQFVADVPILIKGMPRWMAPRAYRNRQRLLDAVKQWHKHASAYSDFTKIGPNDPEWEPYFGSKLIRARQEYSSKMPFMSKDALAAEDLGLIFATNTNAIPSLAWFIFEICRDPILMARVEKEITPCRRTCTASGRLSLDIKSLCSQPLLQSIYAETLRLRVALIVTRTPGEEGFQIGEWKFPPKQVIALSSRAGAMNPEVWNAGTPADPHPLDQFWADRFLIYPDDPTSGPLRRNPIDLEKHNAEFSPGAKPADVGPRFSMEGVAGGWIPYGGGQRMCPGRHFAKQEIIGTLATILTHFEVKLREPENGIDPECDMEYFPFGGLPPNKKIPFSLRRRQY